MSSEVINIVNLIKSWLKPEDITKLNGDKALYPSSVSSDKVKIITGTSDPTLQAGLIWFRTDLEQLCFSPDGSSIFKFERIPIRTDAIADGAITLAKIATDAIKLKIPIIILPDTKTVAVDSTGVKWTSAKIKLTPKAQIKDIILRTSFSSSATDYTLAVYLIDPDTGNKIVEVSGTNLTDSEESASAQGTLGNLPDDGIVEVRVEVTAASATSGATADIAYIVLEVIYGFS